MVRFDPLVAQRHPYRRTAVMALVTLLGAWLGLLLAGSVREPLGPVETSMSLRPSLTGGTHISVPPLGALMLDTHHAPLRLEVNVRRVDPERAQAAVGRAGQPQVLEDQVAEDARSSAMHLALRSVLAVVAGAVAVGLLVFRAVRRALVAGGLALLLLTASGLTAYATWNPKSVLEPHYSGLLSSAPAVVGDARDIVTDLNSNGQDLTQLVANLTRLYQVTSALPAYSPDPGTLRLLHVSDLHLHPAAWSLVRSLVADYQVDLVVDTGGAAGPGTGAGNPFGSAVPELGAPYVRVRGERDVPSAGKAAAGRASAYPVDRDGVATVAGLRIAGAGDPRLVPGGPVAAGESARRRAGQRLAEAIRARHGRVDLAIADTPEAARETDGTVPLVLAGHPRRGRQEVLPHGTRLFVEGETSGGSTPGADKRPWRVRASVLYLDRGSRRLRAWDEITSGGPGQATAAITRHVVEKGRPEDAKRVPPPRSAAKR